MSKIRIIAEVGINHNGDFEIAKKLIESAKNCGADAVKFQKRNIDLVYTKEYLDSSRESPFGLTQRDQKKALEFEQKEFDFIHALCDELKIDWFASCWDLESQEFISKYNLKYNKIASAMLSHTKLCEMVAREQKYTFISTGMHTIDHIKKIVNIFKEYNCPYELMHTCSEYPMSPEKANLLFIPKLKEIFDCDVGYSGHETGITVSIMAATLGATTIERHITLDRSMYGSDQAASLEIIGLEKLIKSVRLVEAALGRPEKIITDEEKKIYDKLKPINF
tara:strand:- start:3404 stop:4240 length:837 start_codon:yes stop_codon:yes gene_type:complete